MVKRVIGKCHALLVVPLPVSLLDLIVAAPCDETRMMRESPHLMPCLLRDIGKECLVSRRILATGKDEILPDHDALFVAEIVEVVALVNTTAPHAQEIAIRLQGAIDEHRMTSAVNATEDEVCRDIVATLAEDRFAIDLDDEIPPAFGMCFLIHAHMAKADFAGQAPFGFATDHKFDRGLTAVLFSVPDRPPEFGLGHRENRFEFVHARLKQHRHTHGIIGFSKLEQQLATRWLVAQVLRKHPGRDTSLAEIGGKVGDQYRALPANARRNFQTHAAGHADIDETRRPIPSELALGFTQPV